jgi:hypothetical protein
VAGFDVLAQLDEVLRDGRELALEALVQPVEASIDRVESLIDRRC